VPERDSVWPVNRPSWMRCQVGAEPIHPRRQWSANRGIEEVDAAREWIPEVPGFSALADLRELGDRLSARPRSVSWPPQGCPAEVSLILLAGFAGYCCPQPRPAWRSLSGVWAPSTADSTSEPLAPSEGRHWRRPPFPRRPVKFPGTPPGRPEISWVRVLAGSVTGFLVWRPWRAGTVDPQLAGAKVPPWLD
jgi:hypothetical protein